MTRASLLDVLGETTSAPPREGGGVNASSVPPRLRNSAVPILTVIGTAFLRAVSGVVVTECVFNIPGLGRLIVDAVLARDYPVIQG